MSVPYQLLPPLTAEERWSLRQDIAAHGVIVPVEVDESGNIIDGHHRAEIAAELGIDYTRHVVAGLSDADKRERALKLNLLRRQLGPIAWAEMFRQLAEQRGVQLGQGKRNGRTSATVAEVQTTVTMPELAAEIGVSYRTASRRLGLAKLLSQHPDLAEKVERGEMHAKRAERLVREHQSARALAKRAEARLAAPPTTIDLRSSAGRMVGRIARDPRAYWLNEQMHKVEGRTWNGRPRRYRAPELPEGVTELPQISETLAALTTATKEAERIVTAAQKQADRLIASATAALKQLVEDLDRPYREARRRRGLYVERAWKHSTPLTLAEFEQIIVPMASAISADGWTMTGDEAEPGLGHFTVRSDITAFLAGLGDLATWHLAERDGPPPEGYGRWSVCWPDPDRDAYHRQDFWHASAAYSTAPSPWEEKASA